MPGHTLFAFIGFDSVSPTEVLVLFAVILIFVGPKNLPSAARKIGGFMTKLRQAADEFKRQLMTMDAEETNPSTSAPDSDPPPPPPPPSDSYIDVPNLPPDATPEDAAAFNGSSPETPVSGPSSAAETPLPPSGSGAAPETPAPPAAETPAAPATGEGAAAS